MVPVQGRIPYLFIRVRDSGRIGTPSKHPVRSGRPHDAKYAKSFRRSGDAESDKGEGPPEKCLN